MVTFKQLEALYWVSQLGSFQRAADRLSTSQAAISKRIHELEQSFDVGLFDRAYREARLTDKGKEMVLLADALIKERDRFEEAIGRPEVISRRVRLGVTELTALTWLPALVRRVQQAFPKVILEPDVDFSASLRDKLAADQMDLIVVPDAFQDPRFAYKPLASVENALLCKPGLISSRRTVKLQDLGQVALLTQGGQSGSGIILDRWLKSHGVAVSNTVTSNSLLALVGLTISGLGVSVFPLHCIKGLFGDRLLNVIRTDPPVPSVPYVAMFRSDHRSKLVDEIARIARECCDFKTVVKMAKG